MKYNTKKIVNGAQIFLYGFCMNRPNICNPNKTWTTPKIPGAKLFNFFNEICSDFFSNDKKKMITTCNSNTCKNFYSFTPLKR